MVYSGNEAGGDWRKAFARQDLYPMGVAELGGALYFAFEGAFGSPPILTRFLKAAEVHRKCTHPRDIE